jgi:hypothetical protein
MDFVQNCRLRSFSDGLHLDSTWTYGVHLDSIWNLWGRVNYTLTEGLDIVVVRNVCGANIHILQGLENSELMEHK